MRLAERVWWERLWRRLRAPYMRGWRWETLPPGGRYRLRRDPADQLLDELEDALAIDDHDRAHAALDRLAEHVGMEPLPR